MPLQEDEGTVPALFTMVFQGPSSWRFGHLFSQWALTLNIGSGLGTEQGIMTFSWVKTPQSAASQPGFFTVDIKQLTAMV